jgi:RecA-family ATPase
MWLYGRHLLRRFVSVDVAAGGVGKSSVKIGEALAMATNRNLYGTEVHGGPLSVWLYNLEDPAEESERRIHATAKWFKIAPEQVDGRLYVDSGRDQRCVIATETEYGARIAQPVYEQLKAQLLERNIDVLTIDPFVSSHEVSRERQPRDRRRGQSLGPARRRVQLLDQSRAPCPQGQRRRD